MPDREPLPGSTPEGEIQQLRWNNPFEGTGERYLQVAKDATIARGEHWPTDEEWEELRKQWSREAREPIPAASPEIIQAQMEYLDSFNSSKSRR